MPLYWTIDSRQQFVVVTADGDVTHADAEEYLAAIEGCGAVAYRKLYDGRAGNFVMSNDNWGWRARIGLFIVGNEAVPEAEWWAMAPPGVSVHAGRVTARAPWLRWR